MEPSVKSKNTEPLGALYNAGMWEKMELIFCPRLSPNEPDFGLSRPLQNELWDWG